MAVESLNGKIVKFRAVDNLELQGFLVQRKTDKAIIHIHGMTSSLFSHTGMQLSKVASKNNAALLLFNNRGHGSMNFFDKGKKHIVSGTSFEKFEDCVHDINAAIRFLKEKGFRKFILSGHSTGCQKVAYYQSKKNNKSVKAMLLLAPADDLNAEKSAHKNNFAKNVKFARDLVRKGKGNSILPKKISLYGFSAKRYYSLFKKNSIEGNIFNYNKNLKAISKIKCPILAVFGKKEEFAVLPPKEMLEKIKKACKNSHSETKLIAGNHGFRDHENKLINVINTWLRNIV